MEFAPLCMRKKASGRRVPHVWESGELGLTRVGAIRQPRAWLQGNQDCRAVGSTGRNAWQSSLLPEGLIL